MSNRFVESIATLEKAAELCDACDNSVDGAGAAAILAWAHLMVGDYDEVPRYRDRALARLQKPFHPVWYSFARAATIFGYAWTGRWDAAFREGEVAIAEGRRRADRAIVSFNAAMVANACIYKQDWERARKYAEVGLGEAPTLYFHAFPQAFLARILSETGEAARGVQMLSQIEPLVDASGHRSAWGLIASHLAEAYLAAGDRKRAAEVLERVNHAATESGLAFFGAQSARLLGEIGLAEGRTSEAATRFSQAIEISRRTGSTNELALALAGFGRLQRRLGEIIAARTYTNEALDLLTTLGTLEQPERLREELHALRA